MGTQKEVTNISKDFIYEFDDPKRIRTVSYYNSDVDSLESNVKRDDLPLVINCTGRVELPCNFASRAKFGRHDHYLMYLINGELCVFLDGIEYHVPSGCAVLFPPEREYRYRKVGDADVQYLWTHFTGYDSVEILKRLGFGESGVFRVGIDENISAMFMQLMENFMLRDKYFYEANASKLTEILIAMRRRIDCCAKTAESRSRIFKSIRFIHANYTKELTNRRLADIEHLSVSQYIELFKRCTGKTPHSYIIDLRMRNACDLLSRQDLTIAQAAQAVGYNDAHYFSRLFKAYRGVSPEKYRKENLS